MIVRRSYFLLSGGKALSKALGAVREILLARSYGTGRAADAYRGSLTLTLSSMHIFTRILQASFIPLHARLDGENEEKANALFHSLLVGLVGLAAIATIALEVFAPGIVRIVLPGFDEERAALTVQMLRIAAIGLPAYVYCALLGALGAARDNYVLPALQPGVQNIGMIAMILVAVAAGQPAWAAWGFTVAYWGLSLVATLFFLRARLLPGFRSPRSIWVREVVGRFWRLARPLLLLSLVLEGGILAERLITSLLGAGRVAAIDYARFVTESAHTLVIVPLGLMSLSYFARLSDDEVRWKADRLLALLFAVLIPLSAYLLVNGRGLLSLLYLRDSFNAESLALTERALWGLAAGLWIYSASYLLQRIANARLASGLVLRAEAIALAINLGVLLLTFRRLGLPAIGIALGAGSIVSFVIYLRRLRIELSRTVRTVLLIGAGLPVYLVLAWLGMRLDVGPATLFAVQTAFALFFWSGVALVLPEVREIARRARSEGRS